jgi:3-methyladenine DNA glycosylase/8-oxoguanine DNA glycosylase
MASIHTFFLPVRMPFDWESLLAFLRLRATPGVETVTDSTYIRTITEGTTPQTLRVTYDRASASLKIAYSGGADARDIVASRVRQIFKTDVNTGPIEAFLGRDPWLASYVAQQPGLRVPGGWSTFEVAMRAILGQQISVPAATTLMGRLVRLAGTTVNEIDWLFPSPEQVLAADLAALRIPGKRLQTLKSVAALFAEQGAECLRRDDAMDRLLAIGGIGKWTAGYILMRTAENHDYWPQGDLVLRKALSKKKELVDPAELAQTFSRWSPYRGYATIHIWRGYVSSRNSTAINDD